MTQKELDKIIDERTAAQIEDAKKSIKEEFSKSGTELSEEKLDAIAEKAAKKIEAENKKNGDANKEILERFEMANAQANRKGVVTETPVTVVNQMIASGLAAMETTKAKEISQVSPDAILAAAKKQFPESKALHATLEQRKALTGEVPTDGGFTIPTAFSSDYIKVLYANTILDKLGVSRVPMPNGNLTIPKMTGSSGVSWLGEAAELTATQPSFGEVNLKSKQLGALCPISNKLLRTSGTGLESWISQDLMEKTRLALDAAFLNGAGTEYTPKGLANTSGIQTAGSSTTAFGLTTPIDLMALLEQANVPMTNVKWLMSPTVKSWVLQKAFSTGPFAWANEMLTNKTLNGYGYIPSSTVSYTPADGGTEAYGDIWLGDFSQMLWGVGYDMSVEMTRDGSYESGTKTINAFQNNLTLVRLITEHDFSVRHANAFVHGTYSKA